MTNPPSPHPLRLTAALVAIVILAGALRLVNFAWGIPLDPYTGYYHPDERKIVQGAVDFPGDILTRTDLRYPTAYHYAIGLVALPLRALLPRVAPKLDPFLATFVLARAITVLLALLSVLATYWLGARWYGPWAGIAAAALLAVATVHVVHGAWATLDVPTSCLTVVALACCDRLVRSPGRRGVVLTAVVSGLLIGTKYPGGVIVVPALLAIAIGRRRARAEGGWRATLAAPGLWGEAALYLALTVAVTLVTTPTIALHPEYLRSAIAYEGNRQGFGGTSWLDPDTWSGASDALQVAVGPALGLLFVLALVAALFRPGYPELLMLAFIVPYYLVLGDRVANRYLIILLPLYCLLVGRLVGWALASPRRALRAAVIDAIVLVWLGTLWTTVVAETFIHQDDVRSQAARLIATHAAAGATVCLDQPGEADAQSWKEPPVSAERFKLVDCTSQPDWVIVISGNIPRLTEALTSPYLAADYTWDPAHADWWPDKKPPAPDKLRFYDALLPGRDGQTAYDLAATFTRAKLPTVPYDVSTVRVWERRR